MMLHRCSSNFGSHGVAILGYYCCFAALMHILNDRSHHTATGIHMPYGITQCYLPPGRGDIPAFTPEACDMHTRYSKHRSTGSD